MGVIIKDGIIYSGGSSGSGQQADFTETDTTSPAYIKHKPTLGTASAKDSTTTIASGNTDLPTSEAVYDALQNVHVDVDTEIDSTSNNPIANSAVADALDDKVDVESGKGLSTNDFTTAYKNKLDGIESGAEANIQSDWSETDSSSDAYIKNKPTTLSAFTNDSGFITNTVNNLTNYYAKTESYSKTEVDTMISAAKSGRFIYVATLPTTDIHTDAIYLVPKTISQEDNIKDEYINLDGTSEGWEKIGDTEIDLSNYIQKSQTSGLIKNDGTIDTNTYLTSVPTATSSALGLVKPDGSTITVDTNGTISASADLSNYIEKSATEGLVKNDGTIDTSKHVSLQPTSRNLTGELQTKTWSGLTSFDGLYVWTDGDNIYYSNNSSNYVLDKSTNTWSTKIWTGYTSIDGRYVWTDGDNIYYSNGSSQYVLDKSTSTWSTKTWNGYSTVSGRNIWTDGTNIYLSSGSKQYILDKSTSTWSTKTWNGYSSFSGSDIWTDGDNIYYSNSSQYVLDKSTSTWRTKSWSGYTNIYGHHIWTDGENIYYSNKDFQYVLEKSTSTWSTKSWSEYSNIVGDQIWTDGDNIYYSSGMDDSQYVFVSETIYADGFVKSDGTIDTNEYAKKSEIALIKKTRYTITATNWSNSTDANGYYTYTITLNPELSLSWPPSTDIAGVNDSTFSTDAEKEAYDLLDECNLTTTSTLILYAKTKPETTFYIWVEGEVAS